jgi:hypothetical protein
MAALPSVPTAFAAAVDMQRKVEARYQSVPQDEPKLCIRVGLHFGPALKDGADFFGETVNVAARMVAVASGRQIITTERCAGMIQPPQPALLRSLGRVPIKGKADGVAIAEVLWETGPTDSGTLWPMARPGDGAARCKDLILIHHGKKWLFDQSVQTVSLGRQPTCDLVIEDRRASRNQAVIERRNPNWVIVDHSTNGTHVVFASGDDVHLHHAELILHGRGHLAFGHVEGGAELEVVEFSLSDRSAVLG